MKNSKILLALIVGLLMFSCSNDDSNNTTINPSGERYFDEIFEIEVISNIKFGEAPQPTLMDPNNIQELYMDVYQPKEDAFSERPLIILAFGGAFVFGEKESSDIVTLCNEFAKRGYVCASIDYRLSTDLVVNSDLENAYEAVGKAMHDMRASIRYFHKDVATANTYKIDPNQIYIGGVSAGALTALHIAHLDESEVPSELQNYFNENGGLSGNSGNAGYPENIAGVISLCGALLDVNYIDPEVTTPIVSMHGTEDNVVPYGTDEVDLLGISLEIDGSSVIHPKLDEYGIVNDFYTYEGAGHTPFVMNEAYMDVTINFVRDFLYEIVQ